jgi:TonB family protein
MTNDIENTDRIIALALTIGFHTLIFLFLFFVIFKTPIPPYPEFGGGSGLEVNFGNSEQGFGDNKSEQLIPIETQNISGNNSDNYITQDNEDNPTISSKKNKTLTTSVIKINDPVVDQSKKLYKKKNNANQGIAGGQGNQGKENGDVNSSNYKGNGGSGGGNGSGNGSGIGDGNGPGTFNLKGRINTYLPKPAYNSDEQGNVVVAITVDQSGKVTKAIAGAKGTTTPDKSLWKQSEQAAYKAKFNPKSDAAIEQKGTITYIFLKLN